ncbi:MAG: sigma-70 family RNA polymerase sigma factor [Colwellia sp.]|nr:sigma-70 family RNA polymerase sigma factor [Colwellia sp.]MCW8865287.1 sigma-70 family RNA polymerase sigma factor [Colwellia sp.]MCW9082715.1 sigma-70 family RNA polymerase sigma factor [Colwellia sp.]
MFASSQEQEWIAQAKQGSQAAFHQLYQLHHKRVYALCWRMLADKDSAEDVCQEVFVVLWQKINNFRGESKFSTWLHSVASNVVLGHLRKQKNWLQRVFSIEDQAGKSQEIEEAIPLDDSSELEELDKHIAKLPERARLVFVLFAVEGYRHEEIANMLNMAVGSSKSQYHRAKSLLKEWLSEDAALGEANE